MPKTPLVDRIMRLSTPEPNSGCWLWTGSVSKGGYGKVLIAGCKTGYAHRLLYEALVSPIPDGLDLDHLCRVRCCVNPGHLEPVTRKVNIHRGESPASQHARKTHCANGHPLSGENLKRREGGWRRCLICRRATSAISKQRLKQRRYQNAA